MSTQSVKSVNSRTVSDDKRDWPERVFKTNTDESDNSWHAVLMNAAVNETIRWFVTSNCLKNCENCLDTDVNALLDVKVKTCNNCDEDRQKLHMKQMNMWFIAVRNDDVIEEAMNICMVERDRRARLKNEE